MLSAGFHIKLPILLPILSIDNYSINKIKVYKIADPVADLQAIMERINSIVGQFVMRRPHKKGIVF